MLDKTTLYNNIKNEMINFITMTLKDEEGQDITIKPFASGTATLTYIKNGTSKSVTGFDALIEIVVDKVLDYLKSNTEIVNKQRVDNYGTEIDTMITTIDTLADTATATGDIPITGITLGTLLTTLSTEMKIGQKTRNSLKIVEDNKGTQIE